MDFIEPCFGIGHNLSLLCQMTSEDIKHQLIIIIIIRCRISGYVQKRAISRDVGHGYVQKRAMVRCKT